MIALAGAGQDTREMIYVVLTPVVPISFCDRYLSDSVFEVAPIKFTSYATLKTAVTYGLLKMSNLSQPKFFYASGIYNTDAGLCDVLANIGELYDSFDMLTESIAADGVNSEDELQPDDDPDACILLWRRRHFDGHSIYDFARASDGY
jgi:hypothetical protein